LSTQTGEAQAHVVAPEAIITSPALSGNTIYFGCADGALYAVNLHNWQPKWRFQTDGAVNSSPSIAEDLICFGSDDGNLYLLNKDTGKLVRKLSAASGKPVRTTPVLCEGAVIFGDAAGNVYSWGSAVDL
jgi:eukaryotic-like serine/threonine-protein kinase